jgi:hypothetical protein
VIYTKSLRPTQAVVWSGIMNCTGVLLGGIAVAYALVELLPAEVLSPPDGGPAVAMLIVSRIPRAVHGQFEIARWLLAPHSSDALSDPGCPENGRSAKAGGQNPGGDQGQQQTQQDEYREEAWQPHTSVAERE